MAFYVMPSTAIYNTVCICFFFFISIALTSQLKPDVLMLATVMVYLVCIRLCGKYIYLI